MEVPSPRHVSQSELATLNTCLRRWRDEVQADVKGTLYMCRSSVVYSSTCTCTYRGIREQHFVRVHVHVNVFCLLNLDTIYMY